MPDVKVRHPKGLFEGPVAKLGFMLEVADAVAHALDCLDYNGRPLNMDGEQVDVELMPFSADDAKLNSLVIVEVAGYDYPDRMGNLHDRLPVLKTELTDRIIRLGTESMISHAISNGPLCSLSFFPMVKGSWA